MKFVKRLISLMLAIILVISAFSTIPADAAKKKKKTKYYGTGTLRIFSTTDLHGQATCYSYDTGSYHYNGSLAQIMTVVDQEKKNLKYGATMLFDSGDIMSGLGAEAIEKGKLSGKQYMFECLKKLGFDAITLGNHDFDFGTKYLIKALQDSKLDKKVVLSNVYYAKSKKRPWAASKIIKKKVKTNKGKKRTVKVGVIGATVPQLSTIYRWKDYLTTTDIIESVDEEADALREAGADLIVVLSHSGIGPKEVEEDKEANVSYALTKLDNVDVVLAGHEHRPFPSDDERIQKYYSYGCIDKKTGLSNKRILAESLDHGCSFGISDIKLSFKGKKVKIVSKKTRQRYITAQDKENKKVLDIVSKYDAQLKSLHEESMAHISDDIENYFGMIEDNLLIQLSNEAKMYYGKQVVVQEKLDAYKDCPVIAGTVYNKTGAANGDDYIDSGQDIRYKDILSVQNYSKQLTKTYYITGAQLKEWLEWQAASAFESPEMAAADEWEDKNINRYKADGMTPVLNPEWENWSGYMVFDGVEYTIDPTVLPRYSKSGLVKLNDTHRISSLTYNGEEVKDDQVFVLVSEGITPATVPPVGKEMEQQVINRNVKHVAEVIEEYIGVLNEAGDILTRPDANWKLLYPDGENYLIKSSQKAMDKSKRRTWFREVLYEDDGYSYYRIALNPDDNDNNGPLLIAVPEESDVTGEPYDILIQTSDASGISHVKVLSGKADEDSSWSNASYVYGGRFSVSQNGIYSFMAVDKKGNKTIKYVKVDNIDDQVAKAPKVTGTVKNTNQHVTGRGTANATVYVRCKAGVFSSKVDKNGDFDCEVTYLVADENISVWLEDMKGRKSSERKVKVLRGGANIPIVDDLTNKKSAITGKLNDSSYCKVVAISGDNIYIPKGQRKNFKKTKVYKKNKDKDIVECKYSLDDNNMFKMKMKKLYAGQKIDICAYDWIYRSSNSESFTVREVAPNRPVIKKVIGQEGMVYGNVSGSAGKGCDIKVSVGDAEYTGKTDDNGDFAINTGSVEVGESVYVTASDVTEEGTVRVSRKNSAKVVNCFSVGKKRTDDSYIDDVTSKQTLVTGNITLPEGSTDKVSLIIGTVRHSVEIDKYGDFSFQMDAEKKAGAHIGILIRTANGNIRSLNYIKVELAKPDMPELMMDALDTESNRIKLRCVDKAKGVLKIGGKYYKHKKRKKAGKYYYYIFKIKDLPVGKKVYAFMKNKAGKSKVLDCGKIEEV